MGLLQVSSNPSSSCAGDFYSNEYEANYTPTTSQNEYMSGCIESGECTTISSYSDAPNNKYFNSDSAYIKGNHSSELPGAPNDQGVDTIDSEDFSNAYYETEDQDVYYEGEGNYENYEVDQGGESMTENHTEEDFNEQYEYEEGYYGDNDNYGDNNIEDGSLAKESYNASEPLSDPYYESNDQNEYYHCANGGVSENGQLDNSSHQYLIKGNEYYEDENAGYYNANGEYISYELNNAPNYNYAEEVSENKPRMKRSKGANGNFPCPQCPKSFSYKSNLNRHINTAHCFLCKACGQKFTNKNMMETHYKQEHQINCHVSEQPFTNKSNINRRVKQNHAVS